LKDVTGFLKTPKSFHTWLAVEIQSADPEFLQVAVKREEILKLRGRTRIPVVSKRVEKRFKPE
jgi:hypothetical protein